MIPEELASLLGSAASVALVRGTIVFFAALTVISLARKLPVEARHILWLGVIASFLLIPLAWLALPALQVGPGIPRGEAADWQLAAAPALSRVELTQLIERTRIEPILTLEGPALYLRLLPLTLVPLWGLGVLILAARAIIGTLRLRSAARDGRADGRLSSSGARAAADLSVKSRFRVLLSTRCRVPFSFGLVRPVIMLPSDAGSWPAARARAVLTHELAHARRGDIAIQSAAYGVCVLFWFVPPVWLAYSAMLREAETCCDTQVVASGIRASEYAQSILELARSGAGRLLLPCTSAALGRKRMLRDRIRRVLELKPPRRPFRFRDTAKVIAVCMCALVPVLVVFGQVQPLILPRDDPFFGTWITPVEEGNRYEAAKVVFEPNGHVFQYRKATDTKPCGEEWKTVVKAWVDAQGWHQYRIRFVSWVYPRRGAKTEGYSRVRISPDGKTREWVWAEQYCPDEITPLGPGYGTSYRQE